MKFERFVPTSILEPMSPTLARRGAFDWWRGWPPRRVPGLRCCTSSRWWLRRSAHDTAIDEHLALLQERASRHEADISRTLWALADQLRGHGLEAASLMLGTGEPADVILSQADALKVDLVVMSTQPPPLAECLLLGSVANRVVQWAHVPILLVPQGSPPGRQTNRSLC